MLTDIILTQKPQYCQGGKDKKEGQNRN